MSSCAALEFSLLSIEYTFLSLLDRRFSLLICRPATGRSEDVCREFSLDIEGIECDETNRDVAVPKLESNEALDDLISEPVHKPFTK